MSEDGQGITRYRWDRYTGKWTNGEGEEKPTVARAIRSSVFLRRWLRCSQERQSLQYFLREYPWLARGACQKRMRRMRAKLQAEQGIDLRPLQWERAPAHTPRAETTGEWARIYRQEMNELPPADPPRGPPEMSLKLEDLEPIPRRPRTAKDRAQTITRDPLVYRTDR